MLKVGVFVDVANQVNALSQNAMGHRVDYKAYLAHIGNDEGKLIWKANAYGKYLTDDGISFINVLSAIGYRPIFIKTKTSDETPNRCLEITLDIIDAMAKLDIVVLGSNSKEFIPLIHWLQARSIRVWVVTPAVCHDAGDQNIDLLQVDGVITPIHVLKNEEKYHGSG